MSNIKMTKNWLLGLLIDQVMCSIGFLHFYSFHQILRVRFIENPNIHVWKIDAFPKNPQTRHWWVSKIDTFSHFWVPDFWVPDRTVRFAGSSHGTSHVLRAKSGARRDIWYTIIPVYHLFNRYMIYIFICFEFSWKSRSVTFQKIANLK